MPKGTRWKAPRSSARRSTIRNPTCACPRSQALTGLRSESAADWLSIALGDPDARVRRTAVEALGEIGGPNSRFLLQQALGDVDPAVREAAQEMLAEPSRADPGVS